MQIYPFRSRWHCVPGETMWAGAWQNGACPAWFYRLPPPAESLLSSTRWFPCSQVPALPSSPACTPARPVSLPHRQAPPQSCCPRVCRLFHTVCSAGLSAQNSGNHMQAFSPVLPHCALKFFCLSDGETLWRESRAWYYSHGFPALPRGRILLIYHVKMRRPSPAQAVLTQPAALCPQRSPENLYHKERTVYKSLCRRQESEPFPSRKFLWLPALPVFEIGQY